MTLELWVLLGLIMVAGAVVSWRRGARTVSILLAVAVVLLVPGLIVYG